MKKSKKCKTKDPLLSVLVLFLLFLLVIVMPGFSNGQTEDTTQKDLSEITVVIPNYAGEDIKEEEQKVELEIEKRLLEERNIRLDIKFKKFPGQDYKQRLNVMFASGEEMDAFEVWKGLIMQFASKPGLLMDLDGLLEEHGENVLSTLNQALWASTKQDGNIKFIPGPRLDVETVLLIRKDLLDQAGLDVPASISELENAFAQFKEMGYIPFIANYRELNWMFTSAFNLPIPYATLYGGYVDDNGNVKSVYLSEKFIDYLDMEKKWIQEGWLPEEHLTYDNSQMQNMFFGDKVATYGTGVGNIKKIDTLKNINPEAELEVIPILESGKKAAAPSVGNSIGIPKTANNPEGVIEYWDWVCSDPDNMMLVSRGIEGEHYELNPDEKEFKYIGKYTDPNNRYSGHYALNIDFGPLSGYVESNEIREYTETIKFLYNLSDEQKIINPILNMSFNFSDEQNTIINDFWTEMDLVTQKYKMGDLSKEELLQKQKEWAEDWPPIRDVMQKKYDESFK